MNRDRRARQKANKALGEPLPAFKDEASTGETPEPPAVTVQAGLASASGAVNKEQ